MKIAIAGAGVAGSYIFRLLTLRGYLDIDVYDIHHKIACGIHPCGYGVDHNFDPLVRRASLESSDYVLHAARKMLIEGIAARSTVLMIDKPKFLKGLLGGVTVKYDKLDVGQYDLVVDATGEARAYAPSLKNDLKARTVQWRVRVNEPASTEILATRGVPGCAWLFPLSQDAMEIHVGAACPMGSGIPAKVLTRPALGHLQVNRVICACGARLRLSGPDFDNIVYGNIWAVGEAAGLVGPTSGAGIIYAMQSGLDLVEHLGDADGYVRVLRKHFHYLEDEAKALRKILARQEPSPLDLYNIRRGWAKLGIHVAKRDLPKLVIVMRRAFTAPMDSAQNGSTHPE